MKLLKLMYFAEREAIRVRNDGITGDDFFSLKWGPILSSSLNLMNETLPGNLWAQHIGVSGKSVLLKKVVEVEQVLSRREISIANEIWARYGRMSAGALSKVSHDLPEYKEPGESRIPITFEDIVAGLGFAPDVVQARIEARQTLSDKRSV